jgi:hypothetical protein
MDDWIKLRGDSDYSRLTIEGMNDETDIDIDDKEFCSYDCVKAWLCNQIDVACENDTLILIEKNKNEN